MKKPNFETLVLFLLPLIVLAGIILLRPHWGLMDDHMNILMLFPEIRRTGLLQASWNFGISDLSWGMFRPTYPLLTWLVYEPGVLLGSTVGFVWNALLSFGVIWYTAHVFSRILGLRIQEVLIANGTVFYQYDLFQHPSLQEKLVLGFGSAFVSACWDRSWPRIVGFLLIGACTKASFMIYFCLGYWAFVSADEAKLLEFRALRPWLLAGVLGAAGAALFAFFLYVSLHGSYTAHYFHDSPWPNLLTPFGPMFLVPVVAFLVASLRKGFARSGGLRIYLPSLGVLAFVAIFCRWGIGGYVESVIGTVFACLLVQNAHLWLGRWPRELWLFPVAILALAVASYRTYGSFVRLHDLGAFLEEGAPALVRSGVKELWIPCDEGSVAVARYLKVHGVHDLEAHKANGLFDGKVFFYDRALCPFAGRGDAPPGCTAEPLWTGLWYRSFRASRLHCAGV